MRQVQPEGYEPPAWTKAGYESSQTVEAKQAAKDKIKDRCARRALRQALKQAA